MPAEVELDFDREPIGEDFEAFNWVFDNDYGMEVIGDLDEFAEEIGEIEDEVFYQ